MFREREREKKGSFSLVEQTLETKKSTKSVTLERHSLCKCVNFIMKTLSAFLFEVIQQCSANRSWPRARCESNTTRRYCNHFVMCFDLKTKSSAICIRLAIGLFFFGGFFLLLPTRWSYNALKHV